MFKKGTYLKIHYLLLSEVRAVHILFIFLQENHKQIFISKRIVIITLNKKIIMNCK